MSREQALNDRRQRERQQALDEQERDLIVDRDKFQRDQTRMQALADSLQERGVQCASASQDLDRQRLAMAADHAAFDVRREANEMKTRQAARLVETASRNNHAEHQRLVAVRQTVMVSDSARLAVENNRLKVELAALKAQLTTFESEMPALRRLA